MKLLIFPRTLLIEGYNNNDLGDIIKGTTSVYFKHDVLFSKEERYYYFSTRYLILVLDPNTPYKLFGRNIREWPRSLRPYTRQHFSRRTRKVERIF